MPIQETKIKASHIIIQLIIFALLIAAGYAGFKYFTENKPEVGKKGPKKPKPVYVEIKQFLKQNEELVIDAMGEVYPEKEISLKPSVTGEINEISKNFYPGGIVKKGEILVKIDQRDYLTRVNKYRAAVKKAAAALDLESGQQESAAKEFEMFKNQNTSPIKNKNLALRKPQLQSAQADLESAKADLKQAEIDLAKTIIKAPFDAVLVETNTNTGSYVSAQENLATLYGTSKYRVKAYVPSDRVNRLYQQNKKIKAEVKSQTNNVTRTGYLKSVTGKITQDSRMAEVLIEVDDPLGIKENKPPLLSGDYVSVSIKAGVFEDVISVPRKYVRDNNYLWIFNNKKLEIRKIDILWKNSKNVLIRKSLNPEDKVITSAISVPVEGMPLFLSPGKEDEKG